MMIQKTRPVSRALTYFLFMFVIPTPPNAATVHLSYIHARYLLVAERSMFAAPALKCRQHTGHMRPQPSMKRRPDVRLNTKNMGE